MRSIICIVLKWVIADTAPAPAFIYWELTIAGQPLASVSHSSAGHVLIRHMPFIV